MTTFDPTSKRIALWTAAIVAVFLLIVILATAGSRGGANSKPPRLTEPVSTDDQALGNPSAPLTLVEYSDFQCPACGVMHPIVKQLREAFPRELQFIYRHFPLTEIHANAEVAARAVEAAGKQGKFWEMHDLLFETQDQWSKDKTPEIFFSDLANILALDLKQFKEDIASKEIARAVTRDTKSGQASRVVGTPTFFLNGQYFQHPLSFEQFRGLIQSVLDQMKKEAAESATSTPQPKTPEPEVIDVAPVPGQTPTLELNL